MDTFQGEQGKTAAKTIAAAAKAALADPAAPVVVTGAADTVGSALANKYMSEARAQVVSDALVADGVAAIAVCLVNSYVNPVHERQIGALIAEIAPGRELPGATWRQAAE